MNDPKVQKLLFIYNADSGLANLILDGAHKILRPSTYNCKLCGITYGAFSENSIWKKFRANSKVGMEFLYKDEFKKQYASKFGYKFTFPIVLVQFENELEVFVKTEELNGLDGPEDLIALIEKRL